MADDESKDSEDAAKEAAAEAQAAAAQAEAAAAGGGAAALPAAETPLKYTVYITGIFSGSSPRSYNGNPDFVPSITFAMAQDPYPGGISDYTSSSGVAPGKGGSYSQVSDKSVLIQVDDGFYIGWCTVINQTTLKLQNGVLLYAQGSAGAHLWVNK